MLPHKTTDKIKHTFNITAIVLNFQFMVVVVAKKKRK